MRFEFDVTATATVAVEALHAREARDALLASLDGADAIVATGPGSGRLLVGLRASPDVVLLRIDGVNPVAGLAEALRRHRDRGE